jgi:hypothetical protein
MAPRPRPVTGGDERPKPGVRQLSALWLCVANHQLILFYWQSGSREVLSFKHRAEAAALLPAEDGALLDWHEAPFKAGMRL